MNMHVNRTAIFGLGILLSLFLTILPAQAEWAPHPDFGLGAAGDYAVLSLGKFALLDDGNSKLDLSQVEIWGDVGVGPYGQLDFQGPSTIHGDLYLHSIDRFPFTNDFVGEIEGDCIVGLENDPNPDLKDCIVDTELDLRPAVADAIAAADHWTAQEPTQVFGRISTSTEIKGNGGLNVITIEGIDYSKSSVATPLVLTLQGEATDLFVLNVTGKFELGSNSFIRGSSKVDPSRVLVNIQTGRVPVQFAANSYVGGTLLSPDRKMGPLQGTSGPVIGALVQEISLLGGAYVAPPPAEPVPVAHIDYDTPVSPGDTVDLDGSSSYAPSGEPLTYQWSLVEKPLGSLAFLSNSTSVTSSFDADLLGSYVVELVVSDDLYDSEPTLATITAIDPGASVDLSLDIFDDPDPVVKRTTLTYTLTVTNNSDISATGVVLEATKVGDVRGTPVVESTGNCTYAIESGVYCDLGELPAGQSTTVTVALVPKRAGFFALNGTVYSSVQDSYPDDNTFVEQTTVDKY